MMDILSQFKEYNDRLDESGIRNIRMWSKRFKEATGYFHMDLDGVTSAIGMKAYLEQYGIKTTEVEPIQYGGKDYAIKKPDPSKLAWLVDFALKKPVNIWTDHHDSPHLGAPEN